MVIHIMTSRIYFLYSNKRNQGFLPPMLNTKIPAKIGENTMQVIRLRTVPIRTEAPVPTELAMAMPLFFPRISGKCL